MVREGDWTAPLPMGEHLSSWRMRGSPYNLRPQCCEGVRQLNERIRRQVRFFSEPGSDSAIPVAKRELAALPSHGTAALVGALSRFTKGNERGGEVKFFSNVSGYPSLYELKVQVGSDPFRALYFQHTPVHYIVVLAVYKNQKKLPKSDRDRAVRRLKTWCDAQREQ